MSLLRSLIDLLAKSINMPRLTALSINGCAAELFNKAKRLLAALTNKNAAGSRVLLFGERRPAFARFGAAGSAAPSMIKRFSFSQLLSHMRQKLVKHLHTKVL
jgi:hypothetical protein